MSVPFLLAWSLTQQRHKVPTTPRSWHEDLVERLVTAS
jgi:hypothetical protein